MSYTDIDLIINIWAKKHSLRLCTEFAGRDARFVYFSSNIGECFQIAIDAPQSNQVTINAYDIETHEDEEMHAKLVVESSKLGDALEDILQTVYAWMQRHDHTATRFIPSS